MTDTKCEPPDAVDAAGNAVIETLRGRRGFASLIDSIDNEILAEMRGTVGLKAIRAYLEVAPVATPDTVRALVEALEEVERQCVKHNINGIGNIGHAALARAKAEGLA
jgi:hypothetical protein